MKFLKKTLKRHGRAKKTVTDRLRAYGAALRERGINDEQETGRWANNRAENAHQPFRRRERAMLRFRRMRTLQQFASVHASIFNHFNTEREPLQPAQTSKSTVPLLSLSGVNAALPDTGRVG